MVEQGTHKPLVVSSSLTLATKIPISPHFGVQNEGFTFPKPAFERAFSCFRPTLALFGAFGKYRFFQ